MYCLIFDKYKYGMGQSQNLCSLFNKLNSIKRLTVAVISTMGPKPGPVTAGR